MTYAGHPYKESDPTPPKKPPSRLRIAWEADWFMVVAWVVVGALPFIVLGRGLYAHYEDTIGILKVAAIGGSGVFALICIATVFEGKSRREFKSEYRRVKQEYENLGGE